MPVKSKEKKASKKSNKKPLVRQSLKTMRGKASHTAELHRSNGKMSLKEKKKTEVYPKKNVVNKEDQRVNISSEKVLVGGMSGKKIKEKKDNSDRQRSHPKQDFKKTVGQAHNAMVRSSSPQRLQVGSAICREVACELIATTGGYCRMHYIKNWKKIKRKELILKEKKLNHYIEELVLKYPDKYIEAIRQDLSSEKDFAKVIADLEIDEGLDDFDLVEGEGNADEGIIDNLKRDFDDDGDVF